MPTDESQHYPNEIFKPGSGLVAFETGRYRQNFHVGSRRPNQETFWGRMIAGLMSAFTVCTLAAAATSTTRLVSDNLHPLNPFDAAHNF